MPHYTNGLSSRPVPPRWLVVKASTSRAADQGFDSRLHCGDWFGRVIPVTYDLALQWLPCQESGVTGSSLGLAGQHTVTG